MTVLPPAAWDPTIRLEPPKNPPTLESRLANRIAIKEQQNEYDEESGNVEDDMEDFMMKKEADHGSEEGLQFTGRLFGGLMGDIRRKLPWHRSDFTDALHIQVVYSKYLIR